jgi:hypothetical protein
MKPEPEKIRPDPPLITVHLGGIRNHDLQVDIYLVREIKALAPKSIEIKKPLNPPMYSLTSAFKMAESFASTLRRDAKTEIRAEDVEVAAAPTEA